MKKSMKSASPMKKIYKKQASESMNTEQMTQKTTVSSKAITATNQSHLYASSKFMPQDLSAEETPSINWHSPDKARVKNVHKLLNDACIKN